MVYTLGIVSTSHLLISFYTTTKAFILKDNNNDSFANNDFINDKRDSLPNIYHFILDEYGSNTLKLHKISTTEYLMEF